jgi:hypothetical protein
MSPVKMNIQKKKKIEGKIMQFYDSMASDSQHRFSSWENCYLYFRNKKKSGTKTIADLDCLQLGFYLASWGMYRGSSFLLDKSYKVHKPIIKELLKKEYEKLWNIDIDELTSESKEITLLFELLETLKNIYMRQNNTKKKVTDTLITKVFLGTLCCTPAYDRYFKDGCKKKKIRPYSNFSKKSLIKVVEHYKENKNEFKSASRKIFKSGHIKYPPMKLIDMYLWKVGNPKDS